MSWLGVDDVDDTVQFMPFSRNDNDDDDLETPPPVDEIRVDHPGDASLMLLSEDDDDDSMLTTTAMISDVVEESLAEITILSSVPSSQVPQEQPPHASSVDSSISYSYTTTTTSAVVAVETASLNMPSAISVASTDTNCCNSSDRSTTIILPDRQTQHIIHATVAAEEQDSRNEIPISSSSWMRQFQTEQDWQEWRDSATLLLHAMNCSTDDDQMLAALIAAEEELFWTEHDRHGRNEDDTAAKMNNGGQKRAISITEKKTNDALARVLETVAVVGAITFASVAVVKIWKGRKE